MGRMGHTLGLQTTVMNIAVIGNRVLGALTLTLFTQLTLLKRLTLLSLTQCMITLFYCDSLGHQESENIAHDERRGFTESLLW